MVTAFAGENAVYIEPVAKQETIQCAVFLRDKYKIAINCVKVKNYFSF